MPIPVVPLSLAARARGLLRPSFTVDVASAAGDECGACYVVLIVDEMGLLVAVRERDLGPDIGETCVALLALASFEPGGAAVVVSVDPDCGTDPSAGDEQRWHELRRSFEAHGLELIDWLLVAGADVASVPRTFGEPATW